MARTRGKSPQPPVKAATPVTEKQQPIAAPPHQIPTAVTVKSKSKNKNKITSYQSEGVDDHSRPITNAQQTVAATLHSYRESGFDNQTVGNKYRSLRTNILRTFGRRLVSCSR